MGLLRTGPGPRVSRRGQSRQSQPRQQRASGYLVGASLAKAISKGPPGSYLQPDSGASHGLGPHLTKLEISCSQPTWMLARTESTPPMPPILTTCYRNVNALLRFSTSMAPIWSSVNPLFLMRDTMFSRIWANPLPRSTGELVDWPGSATRAVSWPPLASRPRS